MAEIEVDLPEELNAQLNILANRHGRSVHDEAVKLIAEGVAFTRPANADGQGPPPPTS